MFGILSALFGKKDNSELIEAVQNGAYIVDVRTPAEFSSGSVPGAVNIPLNNLNGQLKKLKGKKSIVLFCASGGRSGSAKQILESNGFQNVYNAGSVFNMRRLMKDNE